jgi:hypothetical protein
LTKEFPDVLIPPVNIPIVPISQAKRGVRSPLATASTLVSDPGLDWRQVFVVEIAAIALLERLTWHPAAYYVPPHRQVVIVENRPIFCSTLSLEKEVVTSHF